MSDKPEDSTDSIPVAASTTQEQAVAAPHYTSPPCPRYAQPPQPAPVVQKPSRLNQVAAWVGIAAGAVVIVAVIFGTGFMLGAHSGNHGVGGHGRDGGGAMEYRDGPPMWGPGPMMRPGPAFVFPGPNLPAGPGGGQFGPGGPGGSGQDPDRPRLVADGSTAARRHFAMGRTSSTGVHRWHRGYHRQGGASRRSRPSPEWPRPRGDG